MQGDTAYQGGERRRQANPRQIMYAARPRSWR